MKLNKNLKQAREVKNDEFYTQLSDIEKELRHYKDYFKDKVVYCNADDPRVSNFFHYFSYNFEYLGLKKLITTCYKSQQIDLFSLQDSEEAVYLEYTGETDGGRVPTADNIGIHTLKGNGDFRSDECIELLKESDIVVTNPPFSLFREYLGQLIEYEKDFIILGNQNAITYKEVFPYIKEEKVWLGHNVGTQEFIIPKDAPEKTGQRVDEKGIKYQKFGNISWYTNLDIAKRHEELILYKKYNPEEYPKYDNYDGIEVDRIVNIPMDYGGIMGVPVTFMNNFNPKQFEILGITDRHNSSGLKTKTYTRDDGENYSDLNRRSVSKLPDGTYKHYYARILIKNRKLV